jgi:ATP-dependent Zn protease
MHRLGCLLCEEFSISRKYGLLKSALKRVNYFENRKISWGDLFRIVSNGTGEGHEIPKYIDYNKIAVHEAGHALVAIVESRGENIPDVTTILPGDGYVGVVIDDFAYMHQTDGCLSFEEACIKIRIALAGRAAEELIFGSMGVDVFWARDDLKQATRIALDLVAKGGFDHKYGELSGGGINLLICSNNAYQENDFYKNEARILLANQYEIIRSCLVKNKLFLDKIVAALLEKKFLDRDDMKKIMDWTDDSQLIAA